MNGIKVSIITPCLNRAGTIRKTIESVLNQTYSNIEYIIVDGGSTDGTLDIIKEYEPMFQGKMRYISEKDTGIYNAMNKGIRLSTGQMIGIINSDDYYSLNALEDVVLHMTGDPYQVVYGYVQTVKNGKKRVLVKNHHKTPQKGLILHPGSFISRRTYEKYGVYLECFKLAADCELLLRLYHKEDIIFTPMGKLAAYYDIGGASASVRSFYEYEIIKLIYDSIWCRKIMSCMAVYKLNQKEVRR